MSLFTELRRRNVIHMAGLYLVGAWLATQVAATLLPRFFAIAENLGMVRLWEARGYPQACVRVSAAKGDHLDCPEASQK